MSTSLGRVVDGTSYTISVSTDATPGTTFLFVRWIPNPGWCSNAIHGIGIQSTPVIDPAAGLMFLTYRTEVLSNGAYVPQQHLTGRVAVRGEMATRSCPCDDLSSAS